MGLTKTDERTLDEITSDLGDHYAGKKNAEGALAKDRIEFFEAATAELVRRNKLAQKTVEGPRKSEDRDAYIAKYYPGWRYIDSGKKGRIIIEEDPAAIKFVHINNDLVFTRGVQQASPSLDDERIREEDPDLWQRITAPSPVIEAFWAFRDWDGISHSACQDVTEYVLQLEQIGTYARVLRDLTTLSDEDLDAIKDYLVPGGLTIKLEPVRQAKPEDVAGREPHAVAQA